MAERHLAGHRRPALCGDLRSEAAVRAVPDLLPVRRHPQARHGHGRVQGRLPGGGAVPARRRAARLPDDGARLRRVAPARGEAAARAPHRPRAAAAGAARRSLPVRPRGRGGLRAAARAAPTRGGAGAALLGVRPAGRRGGPGAVRAAFLPGGPPMSNASAWQLLVWVALPYLALGIFVVGHVWRWRYDQFGWTSRSTELQERRLLKWGSPVFHYGAFAAIAGHVIGVLIPERWTAATGIPESVYRWFSAAAGTLAAVLVIGGVVILAGRRLLVPRVRATTSRVDYVALILLLVVIVTGIIPTLFVNLFGHGYDYRTTVAEWFRGLFSFSPDVQAIANAPVVYQLHAAAAWIIWAVWPFSRLVHAWSAPLWYLWRPYVVYRSRRPARPAEPGTSGRRWRKIGVPY